MYKIGQFSKISGLTVKALRYYDKEDILKPSYRNKENQYRYYNDEDLKKAQLIKFLRSMEFSITELRELTETVDCEEDLTCVLKEKIKLIENNISKEKVLIEKIRKSSPQAARIRKVNHYQIDRIERKEILIASVRYTGKYEDLDRYIPLLYKAVKNNSAGRHFNCYYDEGYALNADIELCIPIKKRITDTSVTCKKLPAIKALRTTHYGSYDTLYLAYKAMFDYANRYNLKTLIPVREIYIKSPGMIFKGNPAGYITEILVPIEVNGRSGNEKNY